MLSLPTLKKLLRECFPEEELAQCGALIIAVNQRKHWLGELQQRLERNPRVSCRVEETHDSPRVQLSVTVKGVSGKWNANDGFRLEFSTIKDYQGLWLLDSSLYQAARVSPVLVASIEQLESFLSIVQARQDHDHLRVKKSEKQLGFQKSGLKARLRELGKKHQFAFALSHNTRDIHLSIRVGDSKSGYHFAFAKSKLEAMLDQVPELVSMLERMQSIGIHFRKANHPHAQWIEMNHAVDLDKDEDNR